ENRLCRLQGRILDDREQAVDADGLVNRLVEQADALAGDAGAAGVRVADQSVAGGKHVDRVGGERRQRVGHGWDDADEAEGRGAQQGDGVVAGVRLGLEELDTRDAVGDHLQFFNLVRQAADLRLVEFLAAERLRLLLADLADAVDGLAAVLQAARLEFALGINGSLDGGANILVDAPRPSLAVAAGRGQRRRPTPGP